jgi:formate C-acetyltransferase
LLRPDWKEQVLALKAFGEKLGMQFVQSHGPNVNALEPGENWENDIESVKRSLEACAILGIPTCVLHMGWQIGPSKEEWFRRNKAFVEQFFPVMERTGVMLLHENSTKANMKERYYPVTHASPFFSSCLAACVEKGADAYADYGAAYNNASINVIGLGTVVDSLYTIRKLVYEDKRLTLRELIDILDSNWEGQEVLRGIIRNKLPKYGVGNRDVDSLATRVFDRLSAHINNVPNVKGGVYRLGILSIDWRKTWGENTAASADGRYAGETLSQNASATFGMDKEGPTGHILSVPSMDGTNAVNGLVLDIDMHSSAVRGENGTNVLVATLETMLRVGAQTVHYNILDTQILRDAQVNPEKYPNLQVRMCGWNVLFTHLSKKSQDEFIRRSEMLAG